MAHSSQAAYSAIVDDTEDDFPTPTSSSGASAASATPQSSQSTGLIFRYLIYVEVLV